MFDISIGGRLLGVPMTMRVTKREQANMESLLKERGEEGLFRHAIGHCVLNRIDYIFPEILLLDRADAFFSLARSTDNENFFLIGKILRKAAHKLYRTNHKSIKDHPTNMRFLNRVK